MPHTKNTKTTSYVPYPLSQPSKLFPHAAQYTQGYHIEKDGADYILSLYTHGLPHIWERGVSVCVCVWGGGSKSPETARTLISGNLY